MGDAFFFFIKDMLIVRPPVKSSLVLRISVVAFVMVCGVFMCSIGLKQISSFTKAGFVDIRVVERPCEVPNVESWERPYVHFPKPTTFSRAECSCNPVRYFVIASTQRSGSGWFETLLNSHMNVSSNGEIFSVKPRRSNMSTIVDTLDKIYNLDWLTSASKNECTAAVGLKWMLNQIRAHAKYLGIPLMGDEVYGGSKNMALSRLQLKNPSPLHGRLSQLVGKLDRPCLHALTLGFTHPCTGEKMQFSCLPPVDFAEILTGLRNISIETVKE